MLLEFQCANHKSIKEQVTFSMLAGTDNTFEESLIEFDKYRVSRTAVIYGANGSGKSNLIDAMVYMKYMVNNSVDFKDRRSFPRASHRLAAKDTPSEYDIKFVYKDVRYAYGFSVKKNATSAKNEIDDEYLYYFPNKKKVIIFERDGMEIRPGDKYKNSFQVAITQILRPNRLFLSCAANYSNSGMKELGDAAEFFKRGIRVFENMSYFDQPEARGLEVAAEALSRNKALKEDFIKLLQGLGTGVKDIKVKKRQRPKSEIYAMDKIPEEFYKYITRPIIEARLVYDKFDIDLDKEESRGVRRLFQIALPVLYALKFGEILVCDELESSLHERVLFEIVRLFQTFKSKKYPGQLIFSTHNTNLLDSDLFRRDQVWFTELNEERATDLYSLVELKNVRKCENLAKGYISGRYGAIPLLNGNIFTGTKSKD